MADGQLVHVESVRGRVTVPVRCSGTRPGTLFLPFHYGDLDPHPDGPATPASAPHAANELTITAWDPVSKQPQFKGGAVRLVPAGES